MGALALNILACGSLMRPLHASACPLPEKTALENVPDRYSIYNEKEKNLEENILEKSCGREETCQSTLPSGDWKQESLLHKNLTTAHTRETETYKKKVAEQTYFCKQLAKRKWQLYKNYCGETVTLFKNKVFLALFIAIFLFDIGGFPPSLLMEDVARSSNVKEEEFIMPLISIIGIMTTVGKLLLGILADFRWINTLYLYVATLITMGLALCAIPFAKSYVTLAILSAIVGFLTGNWSIFPYVTTKTVGIEKLAHAYGILMFFAGLGSSLGPPIVGKIFVSKSTHFTFLCNISRYRNSDCNNSADLHKINLQGRSHGNDFFKITLIWMKKPITCSGICVHYLGEAQNASLLLSKYLRDSSLLTPNGPL